MRRREQRLLPTQSAFVASRKPVTATQSAFAASQTAFAMVANAVCDGRKRRCGEKYFTRKVLREVIKHFQKRLIIFIFGNDQPHSTVGTSASLTDNATFAQSQMPFVIIASGVCSIANGVCSNAIDAASEKLAPHSRSFREVFVNFSVFSDSFGPVRMRSDAFGCVRMRLDAFRYVGTRLDTFGKFWIFLIFSDVFGRLLTLGPYFY